MLALGIFVSVDQQVFIQSKQRQVFFVYMKLSISVYYFTDIFYLPYVII